VSSGAEASSGGCRRVAKGLVLVEVKLLTCRTLGWTKRSEAAPGAWHVTAKIVRTTESALSWRCLVSSRCCPVSKSIYLLHVLLMLPFVSLSCTHATTCFHRLARVIALRMLLSVRLPPGGAGEALI
jgi:hypothetical protein